MRDEKATGSAVILRSLNNMTTVIDSQIFGNVFSTPEITAIWSDRQRTAYFLHFEYVNTMPSGRENQASNHY
jgi:hypothetical protein